MGGARRATLSIGFTTTTQVKVEAYVISTDSRDTWFDDLKIEIIDRPTAVVIQENHYYPFGLSMKGLDYTAPSPNRENKFQFKGKEKQTELGLNHYDFSARNYDVQINRTTTLDPHADRYHAVSGYSFLNNNPLRYIDPTGRDVTETANGTTYTGMDAQHAFMKLKFQNAYNKKQQEQNGGKQQEGMRERMVQNWKTIDPIIAKENWIGRKYRSENQLNCSYAADAQMRMQKNAKSTQKGSYDYTQIYSENWKKQSKMISDPQLIVATYYITSELKANRPVKVGLDFQKGYADDTEDGTGGNKDKTTDHWVVIVGQGKDERGVYFNYYDNYDGSAETGTNGRLYLKDANTYEAWKDSSTPELTHNKRNSVLRLTSIQHNNY